MPRFGCIRDRSAMPPARPAAATVPISAGVLALSAADVTAPPTSLKVPPIPFPFCRLDGRLDGRLERALFCRAWPFLVPVERAVDADRLTPVELRPRELLFERARVPLAVLLRAALLRLGLVRPLVVCAILATPP